MNIEKGRSSAPIKGEDRASGNTRALKIRALKRLRENISILKKGNPNDNMLAKQLLLEIEYVRALEKRNLRIKIENKLNCDSNGVFTLAEIGSVLGVTRERVRQLELAALKILNHPNVARDLRLYKDA